MSAVGLFAHPSERDSVESMEHDVIVLAMALMARGNRILLHASYGLALPLMLAAGAHRAPVVLEGSERRGRPLVMMPMQRSGVGEDPNAAWFSKVFVGSTASGEFRKEQPLEMSFLDQLEALGVVDTSWLDEPDDAAPSILKQHDTHAVICMGWDDAMEGVVKAAEAVSKERPIPMLVAGPRRGPMVQSPGWNDLASYLDLKLPDIPEPKPRRRDEESEGMSGERSEAYGMAWRDARERVRMTILADGLARQLSGDPRDGDLPR